MLRDRARIPLIHLVPKFSLLPLNTGHCCWTLHSVHNSRMSKTQWKPNSTQVLRWRITLGINWLMNYTGRGLFFIIPSEILPGSVCISEYTQHTVGDSLAVWVGHSWVGSTYSCFSTSGQWVSRSWILRPPANIPCHFANFNERNKRADLDHTYK